MTQLCELVRGSENLLLGWEPIHPRTGTTGPPNAHKKSFDRTVMKLLSAPFFLCLAKAYADNLLQNGSFESPNVAQGTSTYTALSNVPGWQSYMGRNVKICGLGVHSIDASDGNNYIELDGSTSDREGIYQDVPTVANLKYRLSFDVRAVNVANAATDDETVVVSTKYYTKRAM